MLGSISKDAQNSSQQRCALHVELRELTLDHSCACTIMPSARLSKVQPFFILLDVAVTMRLRVVRSIPPPAGRTLIGLAAVAKALNCRFGRRVASMMTAVRRIDNEVERRVKLTKSFSAGVWPSDDQVMSGYVTSDLHLGPSLASRSAACGGSGHPMSRYS